MANGLKRSEDSARTLHRHGQAGHVHMRLEVRPEVKDKLIDECEMLGITMKENLNRILDAHLQRYDEWAGRRSRPARRAS